MKKIETTTIFVRRMPGYPNNAIIEYNGWNFHGTLGRSSITTVKREGDGTTPAGSYKILGGYWRNDRLNKPATLLSLKSLQSNDCWCDDPESPLYNQFFTSSNLNKNPGHEKLWRNDNIYDICLVIDHNTHPRIRNRGSAIFIHLQSPDKKPTQGCIALSLPNMKRFLRTLRPRTKISIVP